MSRFDPTLHRNGVGTFQYLGQYFDVNGNPSDQFTFPINWQRGAMPIAFSNRKVRGSYRTGMTWLMWRQDQVESPSTSITTRNSGGTGKISYSGKFIGNGQAWESNPVIATGRYPDGTWFDDIMSVQNSLSSRGAEAFNRMRPDKPSFDGAQEIAELRDVKDMLKELVFDIRLRIRRERVKRAGLEPSRDKPPRLKDVGEFHLALQFGWMPILRTVKSFIEAQSGLQGRLSQFLRDEGRSIRRRTELPVSNPDRQVSYGQWNSDSIYLQRPTLYYMSYAQGAKYPAKRQITTVFKKRAWAVARFRYLLPPGPRDVNWTTRMNRRLMGYYVTPSTVWNVMPWSWLADYFGNAGDVIEAISGGVTDNLVMEYGYMMMTQNVTTQVDCSQWYHADGGGDHKVSPVEVHTTSITRSTIKCRIVGTPFGFGVKQGDLSAHQLGILGALGLSKL